MASPYADFSHAAAPVDPARNELLAALPRDVVTNLTEAKALYLKAPHLVQGPGERLKFALFPIDAMFSVVTYLKDGSSIEIASIAAEGALAEPVLLSGKDAMFEYSCEIGGNALAMSIGTLEQLARCYPRFREATERFLRAFVFRIGQMAACNRHHSILQRTARWLLTAHDCGNDRISVTHERLAALLGIRRAGISMALAHLQQIRCISRGHRHVVIKNRRILERVACECYATVRTKLPALTRGREQA